MRFAPSAPPELRPIPVGLEGFAILTGRLSLIPDRPLFIPTGPSDGVTLVARA